MDKVIPRLGHKRYYDLEIIEFSDTTYKITDHSFRPLRSVVHMLLYNLIV